MGDRDLVAAHVRAIVIGRGELEIELYDREGRHASSSSLRQKSAVTVGEYNCQTDADTDTCDRPTRMLIVPWTPRDMHRAKGIRDDSEPGLSDAARDQLLTAIAKARRWMTDIVCDKTTFAAIAAQEECGERHIRFLVPLAFLSPAIIAEIHAGRVSSDLTISAIARNLPKDWASQNARILARPARPTRTSSFTAATVSTQKCT